MTYKTLGILALLGMAACNGDGNGGKDDNPPGSSAGTLRGTAKDSNGDAQHASISVIRVQDDGSQATTSTEDAETDAEGRYSVDVDVAGESEGNLIVQALFDDGTKLRALITSEIDAGHETVAPPIDGETDAEANIFASLNADGAWDDTMSAAVLRAFVAADAGADWAEATEEDRTSFTASIGAAVSAWSHASAAVAADRTDEAVEALMTAEGQIDILADTSGDAGEHDTLALLQAAWAGDGFGTEDLAFFASAAAEAHGSVGVENDLSDLSSANLAMVRAELVTTAVTDAWADTHAGDVPAEAALLSEINAGLTGAGSLDARLDAAWSAYATVVTTAFADSLDVLLAAAVSDATVVAVDAQADLSTAVQAASNRADQAGADVATAMSEFRATVTLDAGASLVDSGTMEASQAGAIATILAEVHANATVE